MQVLHHFLYHNALYVLITATYISFYAVFVPRRGTRETAKEIAHATRD
jgi:hypothetical protein